VTTGNRRIVLADRPSGKAGLEHFRLETVPMPSLALAELDAHLTAGRLRYRESVAHGLESAPQAFLGLLEGRNFGKQLVKLA